MLNDNYISEAGDSVRDSASRDYSQHNEVTRERDRKQTDAVLQWMTESGADIPHLIFEQLAQDYRGVCLKENVPRGQYIARIPADLLLTTDTAYASPIGQRIQALVQPPGTHFELSSQVYIAAMILEERSKGGQSYWSPYIAMLPKSYSCMPVNFTPDELCYLQGSSVLAIAQKRREDYIKEYDLLKHLLSQHTLEDYIWARLAVLSRIFGTIINKKRTSMMVPIVDMLNHKNPPDTRWEYNEDTQHFTLQTLRDLPSGTQVFDSYGMKSDTDFLLNYGFVPDGINETNECRILIPVEGQYIPIDINKDFTSPVYQQLFAILKVLYTKDTSSIIETEIIVHEHLQACAQHAMQQFQTTIDEDIQLLKTPNSNRNIYNAIRVRLGEKQLLQWVISHSMSIVEYLQSYPQSNPPSIFIPTTQKYLAGLHAHLD